MVYELDDKAQLKEMMQQMSFVSFVVVNGLFYVLFFFCVDFVQLISEKKEN